MKTAIFVLTMEKDSKLPLIRKLIIIESLKIIRFLLLFPIAVFIKFSSPGIYLYFQASL